MAGAPMSDNPWVGSWTYRSLLNDPDADGTDQVRLFGSGTLSIEASGPDRLAGTIGGEGWSLALHGSLAYGSPMEARFQGRGIVGGAEWVYGYVAWLVPAWPNSDATLQRQTMVGSVVRVIAHPGGDGGVSPAGVVASFFAVRQG